MRGFCPSYFFGGIMNIIKKWFLRIDIEREFDTPIIELYMQDVKTNLFITTLTNNGARISLKDYNIVTLNVLKADDTRLMVSGKVTEDGNMIFEMDSQATSVKGICSATIRIYEGDSSVTSKPFYFSVIDDPYRGTDNSIVSQNSYTALQNILSQTAKALEEAVKVNDYFKVNLPTVKELISYEPILRDIVKNKDEAKELIRESKNLQAKIDASMADLKRLEGLIPEVNRLVDKGNETIKVLTNATESVSETIARADIKKSELEDILSKFKDIDDKAQRIKLISDEVNSLLPKLGEAKNIKGGLDSSIASAKANKASLDTSLESAGDINRDLGNKISQSKTLSNNLKADIENAKTTNFTLNSDREAASLMLINLKNTKNDADVVNSQLNSSQIKANSTKDELDKLVTDANKTTNEAKSINTALKETNSKAEANKTSLESANTKASNLASDLSSKTSLAEDASTKLKTNTDLANKASESLETNRGLADSSLSRLKEEIGKSENLEASLREIIASGDLSKYVTDPKLEEALKVYATKEDLSSIDVTGQLVDYAKKTEVPTKLSQLEEDVNHRIVTDEEKERWNKKCGKDEVNNLIEERVKKDAIKLVMTAVIDQSNSNPLTCVTYEDDAKTMEKGSAEWDKFFGTKLVLFKGGKEVRDLEDAELNNLNPEDGDIMVKFRRMGLNIKTVGDKVYVSMTDNPDDPNFKYYAHTRGTERREAFYLGAYLGYEESGKLRSIKDVVPTNSKTIGTFRTLAQANGKGYEQFAFYQLVFLQSMYILKYGNLDSQTAIGKGLTNGPNRNTGTTNGKGIDFGSTNAKLQMRFQYLEDFYGNRSQFIDGVQSGGRSNIMTTTDNFNDKRKGYNSYPLGFRRNINQYPDKVQGTSELGFIIKENRASQTTYFCDYQTVYRDQTGVPYFGGAVFEGTDAGAFYFCCDFTEDTVYVDVGSRLMFL